MIAFVQCRTAGGAIKAGHVVDQIPCSHHQLRREDALTAPGTSRYGEQPEKRFL